MGFDVSGFDPDNQTQIVIGHVRTSLTGLVNLLAQGVIDEEEARKAIGLSGREEAVRREEAVQG